jgi:hypothetical protein
MASRGVPFSSRFCNKVFNSSSEEEALALCKAQGGAYGSVLDLMMLYTPDSWHRVTGIQANPKTR